MVEKFDNKSDKKSHVSKQTEFRKRPNIGKKPPALKHINDIYQRLDGKKLVFFFDYDGTLTPITSHPDLARLSSEMKQTLEQLKHKHTIAIISGRDLPDVQEKVNIEGIFYAGSHGFDISGPNNQRLDIDEGKKRLPFLDAAEIELNEKIPKIKGAWVERKKYSIAIHYREVAAEDESEVEKIVNEVYSHYQGKLRRAVGKKIFELQPDIPWNKGKALHLLLELFDLNHPEVCPIYLGDDVTDEDAFSAIIDQGLGIAVQDTDQPTYAHFTLKNVEEVTTLLNTLSNKYG